MNPADAQEDHLSSNSPAPPTSGAGRKGTGAPSPLPGRCRARRAVRGGEGFMQVQVDHVEAHVAGPGMAHYGIEVGPVVVEQTPHFMTAAAI